ncbi:hypothetical protein FTUN_7045 [Frigoriglobus tundricola]|uniref:Uncharacterized protein n=1 Tax=Frigoriglobus tundricola TaxID=2774151 RepID=A0A6M5Z1Q7_9BACT|nr:hypothetical protein FTUN_7045 [Frigoriglobus tundricola]
MRGLAPTIHESSVDAGSVRGETESSDRITARGRLALTRSSGFG